MRKREVIYRRILYGLALLPLLLLEEVLFLPFRPLGVGVCLLPLAVGCAAAMEGASFGAGYGLYAAVFLTAQNPGSGGAYLFALSALGFLCGLLSEGGRNPLASALLTAPLCLLGLSLGRILVFAIGGAALLPLLRLAGAEFLTSILFLPLPVALYWLCRHQTRHLRPSVLETERSSP